MKRSRGDLLSGKECTKYQKGDRLELKGDLSLPVNDSEYEEMNAYRNERRAREGCGEKIMNYR